MIVGAGFAGSEAAYALAKQGRRVGLITQSLDSVFLPFTPIAKPFPKGSLLAEVGQGVERAGLGGWELHARAKYRLEAQPHLHLVQSSVTRLMLDGQSVTGVETWEGPARQAPRVVLALGSFLDPKLYMGNTSEEAGRLSEVAYPDLYQHLLELGFAFTQQQAEVPEQGGTPGYRVEFRAFAPQEWDPQSFRLGRLGGLYGLGLCVMGSGTYAQMSEEGLRLASSMAQ